MEQENILGSLTALREDNTQQCITTNRNTQTAGTQQMIINDKNKRNSLKRGRGSTKISNDLQQIVRKNKVKRLVQTFAKKMRMNSVYRPPIEDLQDYRSRFGLIARIRECFESCGDKKGLPLNNFALILWSLINIIQTTMMVFIFSIMLVFNETINLPVFLYIRIASFCLYIVDMVLNFTSQRYQNGKRLQYIRDITSYYLKTGFFVDAVSILIFPVDMLVPDNVNLFISFVYVIKLFSNIKKLSKFQSLVITNTQRQQYYGLVKVFTMNFVIGHFLSILLNLMAKINERENWILQRELGHAEWYLKYVWGYYWGTNIMLTVGFGDISATNSYEAFFLIFIQTFSCITLAYNISYVGAIIGMIRQNQQSKKRKLQTFHLMCRQNNVSYETQSKISNYIREQYKIKQVYEKDIHSQVINSLPKVLQKEYIQEANKLFFENLGFLSNLTRKILMNLAQEVHRKVYYPQQIILNRGQPLEFFILQKGQIALTCKIGSKLDGKVIQCMQSNNQDKKAKIFSLNFLKNKSINYNIKSVDYSTIYYLQRDEFIGILKHSEMDYQLMCYLRDKDFYLIDELNLYPCSICQHEYHNKFQCSRLHYIPIKINIISRYLQKLKGKKRDRQQLYQRKKPKYSSLKNKRKIVSEYEEYIKENLNKQLMVRDNEEDISDSEQNIVYIIQGTLDMVIKENKLWDIQLDIAQNFRYYFKENNPEILNKFKTIKKLNTHYLT